MRTEAVTVAGQRDQADERPEARRLLGRMLRLEEDDDSLMARIALDLGTRIIEGELNPGSDVNSVELAHRFGTSRTPVREALLLLQKQGLVEVPARRRPTVVDISVVPVREIYQARAILVGSVGEMVALKRTPQDLAMLREALDRMEVAVDRNDSTSYFWANVNYNDKVTQVARQEVLAEFLDSLGLRVLQLRRRSMAMPRRMRQSLADHKRVFLAFQNRDTALAKALSAAIIDDAYRALAGGIRSHGE